MKITIAILTGLILPFAAHAAISADQTIGIDFGTITPASSENFNAFSDVAMADGVTESFSGTLINTDGNTIDGVGFHVANHTGQPSGRATGNSGSEGSGLMMHSTVYSDWLISNQASGYTLDANAHLVFTFTGLDDTLAYDLTGGFDNNNINFDAIWSANGKSFTTVPVGGVGYGTLSGLTTDGSGNLEITVSKNTLHVTAAGLTLTAVTPPMPPIESGDVLFVDFGTLIPSNGHYNTINSGNLSISNLVRFADGEVLAVGLDVAATQAYDNLYNVASEDGLDLINTTNSDVYGDGLVSNSEGSDAIVLTFSGLEDALWYDLIGGLSRASTDHPDNFDSTWSVNGVKQTTSGAALGGHVEFLSLSSSSGTLAVTITDAGAHATVAQLALVATDVPPSAELPPAPELPDGMAVLFDPTSSAANATESFLDAVTIGGHWEGAFSDTSRFEENIGGFLYLMDGAAAQGKAIELILDAGGIDFSSTEVAINFEMLATQAAATVGEQQTSFIGFDGTNELFRLKVDSNTDNILNTVTFVTGEGDESMGAVPLRWITENNGPPSGLQDFRIVLSGGQVSCSGSSLTQQDGPVLNAAQTLTSLRWEITGDATDDQGFWLDHIRIWDGLPTAPRDATDRPNIIFVLMDDMGYSDVSCYGATRLDTPNIDALASGGLQCTSFVLPGNVCSPTRASFLTGAYPSRCGIPMAVNEPLENHWFLGLDPDEITIAEQCRRQGYKTYMIGKWHLGTEDVFLPFNQGFDRWLGTAGNGGSVYDDNELLYSSFPETILTSLYTQRVREHIQDTRDRPFFIYYPHNYPHTPYTEGNAFDGSTGNGERSDVLKEVDWSMGQMIAELETQGILENTLIIFSSDNGAVPPAAYGNAPFKGSKYVTWEGGHRVPFIMYWKGQILTPSVLESPQIWAMDVFPTISELAGESLDMERVYDGTSLVPLLTDEPIARAEDAPFYYYTGDNLQCVRVGDWKLHLPRTEYQLPWWDQIKPPPSTYQLYDLSTDPGESTDVAADHPEMVATLSNLAVNIRFELGDADPTNGSLVMGTGQRGTGTLFPEVPTIVNNESDYSYVPDWNSLSDAEKGRGKTRMGMNGTVDPANEFINGSSLPFGWYYLDSSAPTGGVEMALTSNVVVGSEGNTGFSGVGSAALIGSADAGNFVIDSENTENNGVVGTDLLVVPDDYVIVRYTIDEHDVSFGKDHATISGSFRDLVGGTDDDSVTAQVFHNDLQLFSVSGTAGRLLEADGTFDLSDVKVVAGDTIRFVIGSNGSNDGDEVALKTSILFEVSGDAADHAATINSGTVFSDGTATLQFSGTPGLGYRVEHSPDLTLTNGWVTVDELPFLPATPYSIYLKAEQGAGFWRMKCK